MACSPRSSFTNASLILCRRKLRFRQTRGLFKVSQLTGGLESNPCPSREAPFPDPGQRPLKSPLTGAPSPPPHPRLILQGNGTPDFQALFSQRPSPAESVVGSGPLYRQVLLNWISPSVQPTFPKLLLSQEAGPRMRGILGDTKPSWPHSAFPAQLT